MKKLPNKKSSGERKKNEVKLPDKRKRGRKKKFTDVVMEDRQTTKDDAEDGATRQKQKRKADEDAYNYLVI